MPRDLRNAFGPAAKVYHDGPCTILVWHENLLADLGRPSASHGSPPEPESTSTSSPHTR